MSKNKSNIRVVKSKTFGYWVERFDGQEWTKIEHYDFYRNACIRMQKERSGEK